MNVLIYFSKKLNPLSGGTEHVAYLICKHLRNQGHKVIELACIKSENTSIDTTLYLPEDIEGPTDKNVNYIKSLISKENINCVINESANSDAIFLFSHIYIPPNVKIIQHLHFDIFGDVKNFYRSLNLPLKDVKKTIFIKHFLKWLKAPYNKWHTLKWKKYRYKYMYQQSDKIVVLTTKHIEDFRLLINDVDTQNKIISIINPIGFRQDISLEGRKENKIIFVGRLDFNKRIDRILKVWNRISPLQTNWSLVIVGDGPDKSRLNKLTKKWKQYGVEFAGNTDPRPYYSRAKILLLTSNYEGTPMVIYEAMAYGVVPVVMDTFPGAEAMINTGVDGILTPAFDIGSMSNSLLELINDVDWLKTLSDNAKNKIAFMDNNSLLAGWDKIIE